MGMLMTAAYILAMDTFGPIADNAGGIVEMSDAPPEVREGADALDAAGNTTKALTEGYAIGSAALAAFLLFSAFLDKVELVVRTRAHAAGFVGDTVGDPFKDTAGPSLHVLINLIATITLVLAPLFI